MLSRLSDLKRALAALGNIDQEAGSLVAQASVPDLVAVGQRLWWLIKKANKALEPIKERMRAEAGGVTKKFEAGDGTAHCMVICSVPKVSLRKDADITRLKAALGAKFSDLFDERVSYQPRKDFQELVKECSANEKQAVLSAVDMVSDPARISFKD